MINSSYAENNFRDVINSLTFSKNPQIIVEFGILNGYSLDSFLNSSSINCQIDAYDIFDDFVGNGAHYDSIINKYKKCDNVRVQKGDFYKKHKNFVDESIDILHVDIANDGDVYKFCVDNYYSKLVKGGIIILEGGSVERDNVEWMKKYNKTPIHDFIKTLTSYNVMTINSFPSMTIIRKD